MPEPVSDGTPLALFGFGLATPCPHVRDLNLPCSSSEFILVVSRGIDEPQVGGANRELRTEGLRDRLDRQRERENRSEESENETVSGNGNGSDDDNVKSEKGRKRGSGMMEHVYLLH